MQVDIFEELEAVVRRQQKNAKEEKKRGLEKSASHTKSITEIFAAQTMKKESKNTDDLSVIPAALPPPPNLLEGDKDKKKSAFELCIQAAHETELLRPKTARIEKYETELDHRSNYFRRHQMVRSEFSVDADKEEER